MRGGGIRVATTKNSVPPVRLLDITRLASRAGRLPTGVDRVELAYIRELLERETPLWGLARVAMGYVLLDRNGMTSFFHRLRGRTPWGSPKLLTIFARNLSTDQRKAQSDLWRLAHSKVMGKNLEKLLENIPEGFTYLNIGHSNLTDNTLKAVSESGRSRITVMLHDTIPLDFPDYCRADSVSRFRGQLRRVMDYADLVIVNSEKTAADVERNMIRIAKQDRKKKDDDEEDDDKHPPIHIPPIHVAHLGVEQPRPDPVALPADLPPDRPLFLTVGTIEPRKNHALLLDIWQNWGESDGPKPVLGICGRRGWLNEKVFNKLDNSPMMGRDVFEWGDLNDRAVAALLARSQALLFPSFAEGYGLPPIEAAALQTPVVSTNLPSVYEVLKDLPVYLAPDDSYSWKEAVKSLIEDRQAGANGMEAFQPPTWEEHFKIVLKMI